MQKQFWFSAAALGSALVVGIVASHNLPAHAQSARPASLKTLLQNTTKDFEAPIVFQGSGPNASSIQGLVDQFRLAIGGINNANNAGPLASGRREINWDGGGGNAATSPGPTPFTVFLASRGANILTPGSGFVQAPPSGIAQTFSNPSYATEFQTFSPLRLFSPVDSNITEIQFFIPGAGTQRAVTNGFGVVFTDVDQPDGSGPGNKKGNRGDSTLIQFFAANGDLLYSSFVPASPGTGSLSFFAVLFSDARIASVRVRAGDAEPGVDDREADIVMMDDFIYGEPKIGG
jgi:hypothetical protein